MASKFLLILALLGSVSSDRLRFHLENLVDRNVSACDDFYHHVCSQQVDPKEFYFYRASSIFKEAVDRLHPETIKNSPIEYDLQLTKDDVINFEDNNYEQLVKARCKSDPQCYLDEVRYFATHIKSLNMSFQSSIFNNINATGSINEEKVVAGLLEMIKSIAEFVNTPSKELNRSLLTMAGKFHSAIHSRIDMIELMKANSTYGEFHEIKEIAEILKNKMINNINTTQWLSGDEISDFIRLKIRERIASIEVFHDFDETDRNFTIVKKLNRDLNALYFSVKRDTGIHRLDVLLRLNYAFVKLYEENSPEMQIFIHRISQNFNINAFFDNKFKTVTVLAPFMHRNAFESDILKEPFITYFVLGHELYHSLFSPASPTLLKLFESKTNCITDHYSKSCSKYAMGACGSGKKTITEDGPDLESFRALHSLLLEKYSREQLNTKIEGLETTLEQAFFYYVSSGFCAKDEKRSEEKAKEDRHSAFNIRVNAVLSLMPEFSSAFKCKNGDAMYVEEEDSCYVFGPKS